MCRVFTELYKSKHTGHTSDTWADHTDLSPKTERLLPMKLIRTSLITTGLLVGLSGWTLAQTAPDTQSSGPRAERMGKMHSPKAARHAKHLNEIKSKLNLDASQQTAWNVFEQAMQAPAQPIKPLERVALEKLSTPERIDHMLALQNQREAQMKKHAEATKTFYAQLNVEQKGIFDAQTARSMHSMGGGRRHQEGPHGPH